MRRASGSLLGVIGPSPPYCVRCATVSVRVAVIAPSSVAPSVGVRSQVPPKSTR